MVGFWDGRGEERRGEERRGEERRGEERRGEERRGEERRGEEREVSRSIYFKFLEFFSFYADERLWWHIQSPNKGRRKKRRERSDQIK